MRMCRWLMTVVLTCIPPLASADDTNAKHARSDSKEQVISVGNEKAAASGKKDESKTLREAEAHHRNSSDKREHDISVGNEKAAGHGSNADTKSVKPEKTHVNKGKHKTMQKAKGHDKKTNQTAD